MHTSSRKREANSSLTHAAAPFPCTRNPNFDSGDGTGKEQAAGNNPPTRISEKAVWPLFDDKQQQYLTLSECIPF
jgi:hypothetical protein